MLSLHCRAHRVALYKSSSYGTEAGNGAICLRKRPSSPQFCCSVVPSMDWRGRVKFLDLGFNYYEN